MEGLNEFDDSYMLKEDKLQLLKTIKQIYSNTMPWADDTLTRVLVKEHYRRVIENTNREDYINEIKNQNVNNLIAYLD